MIDLMERFKVLALKRPVRLEPPAPKPAPRPDDAESVALESWAQEKDTRVVYIERIDRLIREGEAAIRLSIGDSAQLRYLLGRTDALRGERDWILKTAGLANGSPR